VAGGRGVDRLDRKPESPVRRSRMSPREPEERSEPPFEFPLRLTRAPRSLLFVPALSGMIHGIPNNSVGQSEAL
jgi:hypothetical protein